MTTPRKRSSIVVSLHKVKPFLPFCVNLTRVFPQKGSIAELEHDVAPKPILLGVWEEAVGTLHCLTGDEGILQATIGPVRICLPSELEEKLRPYVGEKIGVLRTDDTARPYRVRFPRK